MMERICQQVNGLHKKWYKSEVSTTVHASITKKPERKLAHKVIVTEFGKHD